MRCKINDVSSDRPPVCLVRLRLANEFSQTIRIYSDLVVEMRDMIARGLESEVAVLRGTLRLAWETVERARLALARHEANHSCQTYPGPAAFNDPLLRADGAIAKQQLEQELAAARDKFRMASSQLTDVIKTVPSGIPAPDGVFRISQAGAVSRLAYEEYRLALDRFRHFETHGRLPEPGASEPGTDSEPI